jgi:hypothetical protein
VRAHNVRGCKADNVHSTALPYCAVLLDCTILLHALQYTPLLFLSYAYPSLKSDTTARTVE